MAALTAKHLFLPLALACGAGLLDARAAEVKRETLPIKIEAASTEGDIRKNTMLWKDVIITQGDVSIQAAEARVADGVNYENRKWTFSGNVRIKAENGDLSSDNAIVYFANNLLVRATITGSPAKFEQQREAGAEPARGKANTIDFDNVTGNVSFKNEAWLSDGCNEIRGETLVYNIRSQSVAAQSSAASGAAGNKRVTVTIQPETPSGKPCSSPGKKP